MTAVNKVAIAGSGVAGTRRRHPARQGRRRGRRLRGQARARARSAPASRCRATPCACSTRSARGTTSAPPATRSRGSTCARPGPGAPVVAELPDVKTGGPDYPAAMGMPRPDLARILARARQRGRCEHPLRREGHVARAGRRRRRGRSSTTSRPGVYDLLIGADGLNSDGPRHHRHRDEARADRHGHLARVRLAPRRGRRAPSSTTAARSTSPATRPTGEDTMYAFLVEKAAGPVRHLRRGGDAASCSRSRARTTARGTRSAPTSRAARTRTTRGSRSTSSPAPWNRGRVVDHRRCRAQLPADDRAGRRPGARGRARAHRAARRPRRRRPGPVGRVPRAPPAARDGRRRGIRPARPVADRRRPRRRRRAASSSASRSRWRSPHDRARSARPVDRRPRAHPAARRCRPRSSAARPTACARPPRSS